MPSNMHSGNTEGRRLARRPTHARAASSLIFRFLRAKYIAAETLVKKEEQQQQTVQAQASRVRRADTWLCGGAH
eukprot:6673671-Pyramimonas_sp.AAC.1